MTLRTIPRTLLRMNIQSSKAIFIHSKTGGGEEKGINYETVDVTHHDERRDILEIKYGVRHVPVVEIGQGDVYEGVTKVGIEHIEAVLEKISKSSILK